MRQDIMPSYFSVTVSVELAYKQLSHGEYAIKQIVNDSSVLPIAVLRN